MLKELETEQYSHSSCPSEFVA